MSSFLLPTTGGEEPCDLALSLAAPIDRALVSEPVRAPALNRESIDDVADLCEDKTRSRVSAERASFLKMSKTHRDGVDALLFY